MRCSVCRAELPAPSLRGPDRLLGTPGEFTVAVCGECGAGNTRPALAPERLAAYYPPGYVAYGAPPSGVARLASNAIRRWQGFVALRSEPLAVLRRREPGRVVDVGCGRGDLAAAVARAGWQAAGVELSEEACALARAQGVDARAGTLADAGLERGAYDAAIFIQSLEHVPDPVGDLRRVRDALRPTGLVLVSVPNLSLIHI